jgi:hypothetical protein
MRILLLFAVMGLSACATSQKQDCDNYNWYEMGRQQGRIGSPHNQAGVPPACAKADHTSELWKSGYEIGLSEYCTIDNAYALGRLGLPLSRACPAHEDLLAHYARGERARELTDLQVEERKKELKLELSQLSE